MTKVTRPVVRWFGGKWVLAPWIIGHFPPHRVYVEPFGGGGSVLLRKPRAFAETWNDLDGDIVNLFRVLRNEAQAARLIDLLRLTPFARIEFVTAYDVTDEPVERARRLVVRSFMGFGTNGHNLSTSTGFRGAGNGTGQTSVAREWSGYPEALILTIERLRGVVIESRDAKSIMAAQDGPDTLHYVDPPYVLVTRKRQDAQRQYNFEMTDADHADLLTFLRTLVGAVVLSGYDHALYAAALPDWKRVERLARADGAGARREVLWLNPACVRGLEAKGERHRAGADMPLMIGGTA